VGPPGLGVGPAVRRTPSLLGLGWLVATGVIGGVALAGDRPRWFVIFGLWGMALVLLAGAALGRTLAHGRPGGRATRMLAVVSCLVGAGLLLRGVGVELLLITGAAGVARNVGQDQTRLSLLLWNPWFVVGGLTFALAGVQSRRDRA